jgi:hypothetical protein
MDHTTRAVLISWAVVIILIAASMGGLFWG